MNGFNENGTNSTGGMQPPPPPPPYAQYQTGGGFRDRLKAEREETIALFAGSLGGLLIIISSFFRWMRDSSSWGRSSASSTSFSGFMLILGLALLIGVVIAYFWRERLAGGIFSILISSPLSLVGSFFAISQSDPTSGLSVGPGAYLSFTGSLLGLLAGLLFLSIRKRENMMIRKG
ncbi:MAG: hypothetical protein A2V52_01870 [Actinobacteria bacterium RBG_19FT_COMBO_54_7]|uniref:Uncharacterized protein n=1 Tax=Candidatus Solincola sediminis TaxID=1797199 RepID=A0A1F2WQD9_9ACTN|nr:MAG: hypothetical protein A2W01_04350 [Candidatus Solincola sediminis]OFW59098.1 MAG: hypothetical protein A2Y75_05055 [Candidatus Solincola sediminis]OFW65661.1 MAG: hypothetical protein A2V52_01870 [Actinobacteria bacterium RBG_19FT_COMBO_54_7]